MKNSTDGIVIVCLVTPRELNLRVPGTECPECRLIIHPEPLFTHDEHRAAVLSDQFTHCHTIDMRDGRERWLHTGLVEDTYTHLLDEGPFVFCFHHVYLFSENEIRVLPAQ